MQQTSCLRIKDWIAFPVRSIQKQICPPSSLLNNLFWRSSVHFSSVTQSCLTPCDPMDCSTPGFPVHHQLPELAQIHVHWVGEAIPPSSVVPFSHCLQSLPASGSFLMSHFFASGGQRVRVSASASVLPVNIQLVYNVVLVSGIQKSESVIYIHISTLL